MRIPMAGGWGNRWGDAKSVRPRHSGWLEDHALRPVQGGGGRGGRSHWWAQPPCMLPLVLLAQVSAVKVGCAPQGTVCKQARKLCTIKPLPTLLR